MIRGLLERNWSPADRACWETVLHPRFLADGLRPATIVEYRKTYQRWLGSLRAVGFRDYEWPLTRVALEFGRKFVDEVRLRTSAQSASVEARHFKRLIKTADPSVSTLWLDAAIEQFARELRWPRRSLTPPSTDRILREGRRLIEAGRAIFETDDRVVRAPAKARKLVRDGLMLAVLAMRPLRVTNFAELRLGESIVFSGNQVWIRIAGIRTKTGATLDLPFPRVLMSDLTYYLRGPRLAFPNAELLSSLWLSDRGTPMTDQVASRIIHARTLDAFGTRISAHQFRHAAVTFLAEKHPELVALAPDILGHASVFIAERFYNLATAHSGASKLQAALISTAIDQIPRNGEAARRDRDGQRSRPSPRRHPR